MRPVGYSTGCLARDDFQRALEMLGGSKATAVELSALRMQELKPLLERLPSLDLSQFAFVSVHAPSAFALEEERSLSEQLRVAVDRGWPVVVHADVIHDFDAWRTFRDMLFIENMDKRKMTGRTVLELECIFNELPDAKLCFDIAHARQVDGTMTLAYDLVKAFGARIGQLHVSEVGVRSTHVRMSVTAQRDFGEFSELVPSDVPIILESPPSVRCLDEDLDLAVELFSSNRKTACFG